MRRRNCGVWAVYDLAKRREDPINTGAIGDAVSCWYEMENRPFCTNIHTNIEGMKKGYFKPKSGKSSDPQYMNTSRHT